MLQSARVTVVAFALFLSASILHAQNSKAVGTWTMTTSSPQGDTQTNLVISEEGGKLKAVAKSERGERPYENVAVDGSKITFAITISFNGSPMTINYTGKIDGGKMDGEADFGGLATGTWSATAQK